MKKMLKNSEMELKLQQLKPLLSRRDKIGYVVARNYRVLTEKLIEYEAFRNALIEKYGEPFTTEEGVESMRVAFSSPHFKEFADELAKINEITQEVDIMTAKFDEVIGELSGEEILSVDWMLED